MVMRVVYLALAFLGLLSTGLLFAINGGDFHQNQLVFITVSILVLAILLMFALRLGLEDYHPLTRHDWLVIVGVVVFVFVGGKIYSSIIPFRSGASEGISDSLKNGYTVSLIVNSCLFSPILEELVTRVFLQKGVFHNSLLGVVMVSSLFSLLHFPYNIWTFGYYFMMGFAVGYAYRQRNNMLIPIVCHIALNSLISAVAFLL